MTAILEKNDVVLAFDLEGYGSRFEHPIVEVGMAAIDLHTGELIQKFRESGHATVDQMEPRCKEEFWDKIADIDHERRRYYAKKALSQEILWSEILTMIRTIMTMFAGRVLLTSDNCAYDAAFMGYNFQKYLGMHGPSMQYLLGPSEKYVSIKDSSEWEMTLCNAHPTLTNRKDFHNVLMLWYHVTFPKAQRAEHDHNAANDAHSIANTAVACIHYMKYVSTNDGKLPFGPASQFFE